MILVDTSVLIDFFKMNSNPKVTKFEYILNDNIPYGINSFIYLELLQGTASSKDYHNLKEYLITQKFYNLKDEKESYEESAKIYKKCREKGLTIRSTIDLVIAQTAIENDLYLLHNDSDFDNIKKVLKELKIY